MRSTKQLRAVDRVLTDYSLRGKVSPEEWQARVDLAACYHLCNEFGVIDRINTHISMRVPGEPEHYLLNPLGLLFDEITASSLVKVDLKGNKVGDGPYDANPAGIFIHGSILAARSDLNCVLHHHTNAGIAVGAMEDGLMPISQHAILFYNRIGYMDYPGIGLDEEERRGMARALGNHSILFLRNHGMLVCGRTVGEAFVTMDDIEKACQTQLAVLATGRPLRLPPPEVCEDTAQKYANTGRFGGGEAEWRSMVRILDRKGVAYAQ